MNEAETDKPLIRVWDKDWNLIRSGHTIDDIIDEIGGDNA